MYCFYDENFLTFLVLIVTQFFFFSFFFFQLISKSFQGNWLNSTQPSEGQSAGSSDKPYKPVHEKKLKFTYKEQKEFDEIDAVIAGLEESIAAVQEEINLQSANFTRLQELLEEKESLEGALAEKMDRWVYLNDLNDQIQQQNSKA